MGSFFPSDPHNRVKSMMEYDGWLKDKEEQKAKEKRETRRFIITCTISGIAAVAAILSVLIQICPALLAAKQ